MLEHILRNESLGVMNRLLSQLSLVLVLVLGGCGPFLLLPGGQLSGRITPVPGDWDFVQNVKTIQLETRPSDPYSVNIWVTAIGSSLYLHAGAKHSKWVGYIEDDPNVRVRIKDDLYELRATRVVDPNEFGRFADAYEAKFGVRPRNENVAEVYLMRLDPS